MGGATLRNGKAFSRKPTGMREQASSSSCTRYANGRKRPPSRVLQRQKGANTAFKKAGVTYAPKQSERHRGLRGLKQESFKSVLAWSETKCKNYLMTLQVLGSARGRLCYACRSPLHATSAKKVLRCKNSDCTRPRAAVNTMKLFYLCFSRRVPYLSLCCFATQFEACITWNSVIQLFRTELEGGLLLITRALCLRATASG